MEKKKIILLGVLSIATIGLAVGMLVVGTKKREDNLPEYTVSFDTNGGTTIPSLTVKKGSKIQKPNDPTKEGYHVINWLKNDTPWIFEKYEVHEDMTLVVTWDYNEYTITYNFEGGSTTEHFETTFNIDSSFDLIRPIKDASLFVGWFDSEGHRIDRIEAGTTGNITITARWVDNLVISSLDTTKGDVLVYGDEEDPNKFTVKNIPVDKKYHVFKGWYDENSHLLSEDTSYTFTVKPNEMTYINSEYMSQEEEDEWNIAHGVVPSFADENHTIISFGLYPQSNVNDQTLIYKLSKAELTNYNGYYYLNHEYYSKKIARIAKDVESQEPLSIHNFDNGSEILEGEEYWFKVESISWKVLNDINGDYYLLSDKLIDVKKYDSGEVRVIDEKTIMPSNYKYSDIRHWLNNGFYNNVFNFNKNEILRTEIDNSAETTATPDSGFECENTNDKVSLLSYKEYFDYGNGTSSSTSKRCFLTTDYTRASNALYSTDWSHLYTGYSWTRSPISTLENNGFCVSRNNMNGTLNSDYVGFGESCVQPVITIHF